MIQHLHEDSPHNIRVLRPAISQFVSADTTLGQNGYDIAGHMRYTSVHGGPEMLTDPACTRAWPLALQTHDTWSFLGTGALDKATIADRRPQAAQHYNSRWI